MCVISDDEFATSSRDKSIKVWRRAPPTTATSASSTSAPSGSSALRSSREFTLHRTLIGHSSYVGPLVWLPLKGTAPSSGEGSSGSAASNHSSGGRLVSGSMDSVVIVWDVEKGEALQRLEGHQQQVTSLAVSEAGEIISGSVDK